MLSVCFGASFYLNVLALESVSASFAGAGRLIVAAFAILPLAVLIGPGLPRTRELWVWCSVLGMTTYVMPFYLVAWVQTKLPSNVTALYFVAIPLLLLLMSRMILGVVITRRKGLGLAVGCAGLVYLSGPGALSQIDATTGFLPQFAMVLVCVLLAGSAIIVRLIPQSSPLQINAGAMLVAGVFSMPVAYAAWPQAVPTTQSVLALLGVGLFSTALGQFLRFTIIRRRGPVFLAPNGVLSTMVAVVLAVFLLDEAMTAQTWIAFGIMFAGLIIASDGSGHMKKL